MRPERVRERESFAVASVAEFAAGMIEVGARTRPLFTTWRDDPMLTTETGRAGARPFGWRFCLAALLGALTGATLFPRPAKGQAKEQEKRKI